MPQFPLVRGAESARGGPGALQPAELLLPPCAGPSKASFDCQILPTNVNLHIPNQSTCVERENGENESIGLSTPEHPRVSRCISATWEGRGLRDPIHKHGGAGISARQILTEDTQAQLATHSCEWDKLAYGDMSFTVQLHTRNEVCTEGTDTTWGRLRGPQHWGQHSVSILGTLHFTSAKFFLRRAVNIVEMLPGSARALKTVTKSTWAVQPQPAVLGAGGLSPAPPSRMSSLMHPSPSHPHPAAPSRTPSALSRGLRAPPAGHGAPGAGMHLSVPGSNCSPERVVPRGPREGQSLPEHSIPTRSAAPR